VKRYGLFALVVLACAAAPLFAPQAWVQHGAFPDVAALAVLYLAISGTPERAAVLGVAIGLLRCAWTPDPTGLDAALYGTLGWSGAHFGRAVFQDRVLVQMAAAGVGVIALRAASAAVLSMSVGELTGTHGMSVFTWLAAAIWCALATALAAPVVFAVLSGTHVLASFEKRRARDV
jgi:rod shape-determining protein MreD